MDETQSTQQRSLVWIVRRELERDTEDPGHTPHTLSQQPIM